MPISIQASAGLLTPEAEQQLFAGVMESFLRINGAAGNSFITPNLIGDGVTIPAGRSFAGGVQDDFVVVGLKVPAFSLPTQGRRQAFVTDVTDLVKRLVEGRLPRARVAGCRRRSSRRSVRPDMPTQRLWRSWRSALNSP